MKKLLFSSYSLDIGGIETSLITLINELSKKKYDITLVLEKKQGIFLKEIDKKIKIIEYTPNNNGNVIIRKFLNFLKRIKFILKYKNKFDFSVSFATYSLVGSFVSRQASRNCCIWVHSNYMSLFDNDTIKFINFFNDVDIEKFKSIIFVSNDAKNVFIKEFKNLESKCKVVNNIIDYKKILKLSEEKIEDYKRKDNTILYVGRLTEEDKKISRIIEASKKLKEDGVKFTILIIGDGKNKNDYITKVNEFNLKENIIFLGKKKNPYPYFKISDFLILTSEYEGFPVVYNEAKILGLPILTTNVSDSNHIVGDKYGIVTTKSIEDIYKNMKKMLEKGFELKEGFNVEKYNKDNIELVQEIINCN